jgi:NAD(P)-dependent dehydrogenase (short-subunit alcohol dehydrogenase family)
MKSFAGKVAVVTGGGTGMGRELCRQLAAEGASDIAMCDVSEENMAQTRALCLSGSAKVRVTTHLCDVSIERQVIDFRDQVVVKHEVDHVDLLFNNAGIGGGGSFVSDERGSGIARSRCAGAACTTARARSCRCSCAAPRRTCATRAR